MKKTLFTCLAVLAVLLWVGGAFYLARQDVSCQMVFGDACTVSKAEQARRDNIKLATRGGAILCLSVAGILFVTAAGRRKQ